MNKGSVSWSKTKRRQSACDLAGRSVGRFKKGPKDLSRNSSHMKDFGK